MIEGGITSRMSGIIDNAGHHPSPQDYRYYCLFFMVTHSQYEIQYENMKRDYVSVFFIKSVEVKLFQSTMFTLVLDGQLFLCSERFHEKKRRKKKKSTRINDFHSE